MIKSIWRVSHFLLAVFSSIFLLIASLTGGLLAFEPITNKIKAYQTFQTHQISVAETINNLQKKNKEIFAIKNEKKGHIIAELSEGNFYINPKNGELLGKTQKQSYFFKFLTSLHRSLFLKSTGRILIGIASFLLFLIAITGILLILKRQKKWKVFFDKIVKETPEQFYHIIFGRLALVPIIILALTGTYLSLQRFKIIPKQKIKLEATEQLADEKTTSVNDFSIFKTTNLSDLKELKFPFSEDKNEFFHLILTDKELLINQFTGRVVSEKLRLFSSKVSQLSYDLHTGYFGVIWAFVLIFASFSIPYFMYSGFLMTYKRLKGKVSNKFKSNDCEYILLIGSENGSSQLFAKMLYKGLLAENKKTFITTLNNYKEFPKMKHLIVLSATYGDGEAPANASNFINLVNNNVNNHSFLYSVVGFGSLSYSKFCQFAVEINNTLQKKKSAIEFLSLQKINNKSFEEFSLWMNLFNGKTGLSVVLDKAIIVKRQKQETFKIIGKKTDKRSNDNTFLLTLIPNKKRHFYSGDLLGIYPNKETHERLYSVAKINEVIILSVKLHEKGLCSNYLYTAKIGSNVNGYIKKNKLFHFPKKAPKVIMIATGTGIAPFLGMVENNENKIPIDLYFGVRSKKSLLLYTDFIQKNVNSQKIANFYVACSRELEKKVYVQDVISHDIAKIIRALEQKAVIMLCGSIAMQKAVFEVLDKNLIGKKSVSFYKKRNQILVDCY